MKVQSLNNKIIVEPYTGRDGLRTEIRGGLALPGQKIQLLGLKVLVNTTVNGQEIKAGSTVYFSEEYLYSSPLVKKTKKSDFLDSEFIILEANEVVAVKEIE